MRETHLGLVLKWELSGLRIGRKCVQVERWKLSSLGTPRPFHPRWWGRLGRPREQRGVQAQTHPRPMRLPVSLRGGNTCCSGFCNTCRITTHQPCGLKWKYTYFYFFPEQILVSWILCRRDAIITSSVNPVRVIFSFPVVSLRKMRIG